MAIASAPRVAAVIVAAGRGTRAGGDVPKQWREVAGARVLDHTLKAFHTHEAVDEVVLCLHADDLSIAPEGCKTVAGGPDRASSVAAGLRALAVAPPDFVLIHDVARPCLSGALISRVLDALRHHAGAAPALPVTDALWRGANGRVDGTQDRTGLFRAQTPQGFAYAAICAAHASHPGGAADDVEVARAAGLDVAIVEGEEDNLKITLPADFDRAARILEARSGHQAG